MGIGIIILSIGGIVAFFFYQTLSFVLVLLAFAFSIINIIVKVFQEKRRVNDLIAIGVTTFIVFMYIILFIVISGNKQEESIYQEPHEILESFEEEMKNQIDEIQNRIVEKTEEGAATYEEARKEEEEMLKQVQEFLNSSK